jgi:hypothetical protein
MIFPVILPGVILANVRYKWLIAGVWGAELSSGITDTGEFGAFVVDAAEPANAQEFVAYDKDDHTNFARGNYMQRIAVGAAAPTAAEVADAVWDELAADHVTTGTIGKKVSDAASAGDPWSADLPGAYTEHQAGAILSKLDIAEPETPVIVIPAPEAPNQSVGYIVTRDNVGDAKAAVSIAFWLLSGAAPDSYETSAFAAISDADGLLTIDLAKGATYKAQRGDGQKARFTVPLDEDSFQLPQVLGKP